MWGLIIYICVAIAITVLYVKHLSKKDAEREQTVELILSKMNNFNATIKIVGYTGYYIFAVDEKNEKIAYITEKEKHVIDFSDIIGVELIENGFTVSKKSAIRTIGGSIVGGALGGGAGTVVGGLSGSSKQNNKIYSVSVKILLRNLASPALVINCFDARTMMHDGKAVKTEGTIEGLTYKTVKKNADDIKDIVSVIIDRVDNKVKASKTEVYVQEKKDISLSDELLKLSELKAKGELTEEEFVILKKKLLN